jgi:hypothetical protein
MLCEYGCGYADPRANVAPHDQFALECRRVFPSACACVLYVCRCVCVSLSTNCRGGTWFVQTPNIITTFLLVILNPSYTVIWYSIMHSYGLNYSIEICLELQCVLGLFCTSTSQCVHIMSVFE